MLESGAALSPALPCVCLLRNMAIRFGDACVNTHLRKRYLTPRQSLPFSLILILQRMRKSDGSRLHASNGGDLPTRICGAVHHSGHYAPSCPVPSLWWVARASESPASSLTRCLEVLRVRFVSKIAPTKPARVLLE